MKRPTPAKSLALLVAALVVVTTGYAQRERQVPPLQGGDYDVKFLDELQRLYGRLSNGDVYRAFERARPVKCSELVRGSGEWKDVAFFNGSRKWYSDSLAELNSDQAVYIFQGVCRDERTALKITTKVPLAENESDQGRKINFTETRIKVNPPVNASFKSDNKSYVFDLPYLFYGKDDDGKTVFTFYPSRLSDKYLTHIISHWECKALTEEYLTHDFMICHTQLFGRDPIEIRPEKDVNTYSFNASAYSILSDGKETLK